MVSVFNGRFCNVGILSLVLTAFSMTYAVPIHTAQNQVGVNEAALMMKIENLVK